MKTEIHPVTTRPTLTPAGHAVFQLVLEAMQDAEEIWGPDQGEDYRDLMADIANAARGERAPEGERQEGIYQRTVDALLKGLDFEHFADFQALCARTAAEAEARIANSLDATGAEDAYLGWENEVIERLADELDIDIAEATQRAADHSTLIDACWDQKVSADHTAARIAKA